MYIFDVSEGAAGDMILGALVDAGIVPLDEIQRVVETAARVMDPTAKVIIKKETVANSSYAKKMVDAESGAAGELGISVNVVHWKFDHVSAQSMKRHLNQAIRELEIQYCRETANKIFDTILEAESTVHLRPVDELHLHETGSPDTLVDIIGTVYLLSKIEDDIACTEITAGYGKVEIAHGIVDVPAPATKEMLKCLRWKPGPYRGELTTPTGAALLKNIIKRQVDGIGVYDKKIGTGFGTKTFGGMRTAVRLFHA